MPGNDGVDLGEAFFGEEGEVFFQGGEGKFEGHVEGGLAEKLAHEGVVVRDVMEAVVVAAERKPDDSEDENLPEIHAGATGGFWVGGLDAFEDGEDFAVHFGCDENPLEGGEDGRKFVTRLGGDFDFFDGHGSEGELDVE
ncbi:MAG: hypothetical protein ACJA1W_003297 [Akkermansiaceae bacterium]|jgi:hypothetical protein